MATKRHKTNKCEACNEVKPVGSFYFYGQVTNVCGVCSQLKEPVPISTYMKNYRRNFRKLYTKHGIKTGER